MSRPWLRRAFLALVPASLLLLAACGSSTIESQLQPSRVISFGDALSDLGQTGKRYTVNNNATNIWTEIVSSTFGVPIAKSSAGGTSFATGNARTIITPDAAGNSATPTISQQIDAFLVTGKFGPNDLVLINGGISDIIAETTKFNTGAQTAAQLDAAIKQDGRDLAAQVRRLVQAGATHVVVVGPYDLGRTPWAITTSQTALLSDATTKFNTQMLITIVELGSNVLYVDAALLFNLMSGSPGSYGFSDATNAVCTSVDPGPGIGIGAGKVNSALCTPTTLLAGADYNGFLFADPVYPTPAAQIQFGSYAYSRIRSRW